MIIDLQIHTVATPHHAQWQPEALVLAAVQVGLHTIAATDHNTLGSVRALIDAGVHHDLRVISGVEIDSGFSGKLWHTLVYGVPPENAALQALCDAVFARNRDDAEALRDSLIGAGYQLATLATLTRPPSVADVATALAHENRLAGRDDAELDESAGMRYVLTELAGAYQPLSIDAIIRAAHAEGGTAVLAHPGRSKGIYAVPATEADIALMVEAGLDGVEVYYPSHTVEQQAFYREIATRHNLLVTGGSDSHGPSQPLAQWPSRLCQAFLERVEG